MPSSFYTGRPEEKTTKEEEEKKKMKKKKNKPKKLLFFQALQGKKDVDPWYAVPDAVLFASLSQACLRPSNRHTFRDR